MTDKTIAEQALEEVQKEEVQAAKERLKTSLRVLNKARTVYENAQREHNDLVAAINQGN